MRYNLSYFISYPRPKARLKKLSDCFTQDASSGINTTEPITLTAPLNQEVRPPASKNAVMLQLIFVTICIVSAIIIICSADVRKLLHQAAAVCSRPFPPAKADNATGATPISINRFTNLPATSINIVIEHTPAIIR